MVISHNEDIAHCAISNINANKLPNSDFIKIDTFIMRRFEFQNRFCNLSLVLGGRLHLALCKKIWCYRSWHMVMYCSYFDKIRTTPMEIGTLTVSYQMYKSTKDPDFLKKFQMHPISQDQWQITKSILKFKSTHPIGTIFNGIRFGWIFSTIKRSLP